MVINFGVKTTLQLVSHLGHMTCTNCGQEVRAALAKEGGYVHIFFIPVFPVLTGYKMVYCPNCGIMRKLSGEEFKEMKQNNPPIK
jgi:predicted RNA-binding Zn-ribbon protein involved in translation (DUF1610 family)